MGHKVDLSEVIALSDKVKTASNEVEDGIEKVLDHISSLRDMASFSGEAASSAKNYFGEFHGTLLESLYILFFDLKENLNNHIEKFQSNVDTNEQAIIQTDYLDSIRQTIDLEYQKLSGLGRNVQNAIQDISDIVSINSPTLYDITKSKRESVKIIDSLENELGSFTNSSKAKLNETKELIHDIEVAMRSVKSSKGEARFNEVNRGSSYSTVFKLQKQNEDHKIRHMDSEVRVVLDKAFADYQKGVIDKETYDSIKSGLINTGAAFLKTAIEDKLTDDVINSAIIYLKNNTEYFVNRGLVAAPVYGNVVTFTEPPTKLTQIVRTGATRGIPIIGAVVDFGLQVSSGEDATDAAIKATGHLGAGLAGAAIGSVIPFGGTAIGFAIGVGGSVLFDWVYDNKEKIAKQVENIGKSIVNTGKEIGKNIGDAVSGFFGNLGSIFS